MQLNGVRNPRFAMRSEEELEDIEIMLFDFLVEAATKQMYRKSIGEIKDFIADWVDEYLVEGDQ